jgi:hypothetical protein
MDLKIQTRRKGSFLTAFKNYMETEIVDPACMESYRFMATTRNPTSCSFLQLIIYV